MSLRLLYYYSCDLLLDVIFKNDLPGKMTFLARSLFDTKGKHQDVGLTRSVVRANPCPLSLGKQVGELKCSFASTHRVTSQITIH